MKLTKHLFGIALTAIASSAFVACTNELSDRMETSSDALKLLRAPEVYAWSGEQTLNATRSDVYTVPSVGSYSSSIATRDDIVSDEEEPTSQNFSTPLIGVAYGKYKEGFANGKTEDDIISWTAVKTPLIDRPKQERFLKNRLPEDHGNLDQFTDVDFDFIFYAQDELEFEFYPVYTQTNRNNYLGIFYYSNGQRKEEYVWKPMNFSEWGITDEDYDGYLDDDNQWVEIKTKVSLGFRFKVARGTKFGFFWEGIIRNHDDDYVENQNKKTFYTSEGLNPKCYLTNADGGLLNADTGELLTEGETKEEDGIQYRIYSGIFYDNGCTYLGIEDCTDFDYQDWVFMCPDVLVTVDASEIDPETGVGDPDPVVPPTPDSKVCENCGHEHNGPSKNCPDCRDNGPVENYPGSCWEDPEVCENCGHEHNGPSKNCPDCRDNGPVENYPGSCWEDKGTNTPTAPDDIIHHKNEVEVNFELVDSHEYKGNDIKDLASKLSIHVRHATDVEIKIPVPTRYVIQSDDLYIFNEHYGQITDDKYGYHGTYGGVEIEGGKQELTYSINGSIVKLYVQYVTAAQAVADNQQVPFRDGYIKVWTDGITDEVINWCMLHNGDGINFEVWTYFGVSENSELRIDRDDLEYNFNQSKIWFLDSAPDYYINAFGYDYEDGSWGQTNKGYINPDDCFVTPDDTNTFEPRIEYTDWETMQENTVDEWDEHLNSTPYNYIWVNKNNVTNADEYHGGLN